jgi:hypothetical protein
MNTTGTDPMPYANDAEGMKHWHHRHGLPWGAKYLGPDPMVVRRMQMAGTARLSLGVHLSNEHGVDDRKAERGSEVEHMYAHLTGRFRLGQEHYHQDGS